jgi:hypothetical protein
MKITTTFPLLAAAGLIALSTSASAQSPSPTAVGSTSTTGSNAPYTEGTVTQVTFVRTKAGMTDDYLKNLAKNYRMVMDEAKKANTIVGYSIFPGDPATEDDFDVMLMVEYKNMAALDSLRDKMDPIELRVAGGEDQARQGSMKRAEIREILGTKTLREVTLK